MLAESAASSQPPGPALSWEGDGPLRAAGSTEPNALWAGFDAWPSGEAQVAESPSKSCNSV